MDLGPSDVYSVIVLWRAWGLDGMTVKSTGVNFKPTTGVPLPFNSGILLPNVPKVWVAVAYFVGNKQIYRKWNPPTSSQTTRIVRHGRAGSRDLQLQFSLSTLLIVVSMFLHWVVSHAISEEEVIRSGITVQFSAGASMITANL